MKWLLMALIHLYWIIPQKRRRRCIFKQTCSKYVYQTTKEKGFFNGIQALKQRMRQCRPAYALYTGDDREEWVILPDKEIIPRRLTNV
jgi:putative component of membrane protein insertase Oxa1/YidC/SpoIIIJ protein YidD